LVAGCAVATLGWAASASAHASLIETDPAPEATLDVAPRVVTIVFDETVAAGPDAIRLFGPGGDRVGGVKTRTSGPRVEAKLPRLDRKGTYTVGWRVLSADGHPIGGAWVFHLEAATAARPDPAATRLPATSAPVRIADATGTAIAITALGFAAAAPLWLRRLGLGPSRAIRRILWTAGTVGVAALVGALIANAFTAAGGLSGVPAILAATPAALFAGVAVLAVSAGWMLQGKHAERRSWVAAAIAVAGTALSGHAATATALLATGAQLVHVGAFALWGCGLALLAISLRRPHPGDSLAEFRRRVLRFSPVAAASAGAIAVTGLALAWLRVGWDQLFATTYGWVVVAKCGLFAAVVVAAGLNRFVLLPAPERPAVCAASGGAAVALPERTLARLDVGLRVELVLMAAAVATGSLLGTQAPPTVRSNFDASAPFGRGEVQVTVSPAALGRNEIHAIAVDGAGMAATEVEDMRVELRLPSDRLGPLRPQVVTVSPGHIVAPQAHLARRGEWRLTVTGRHGDFEAISASFTVPVR
jgi:copper transport protein